MSVRYVPEARVWVVTYEPIKGCPFTYVTWIAPLLPAQEDTEQ